MSILELQAGKRFTSQVRIEGVNTFESEWGEKSIVRMRTPEGESLVWFTNGTVPWAEAGLSLTVKATHKRVAVHQGKPRLEVVRVVPV